MKTKITILGIMISVGIMLADFTFSLKKEVSHVNFTFANIEALAQDEEEEENCEMSELSKTDEIIVIKNARNRLLGIAAGCKKKCDSTCTVKKSPDIDVNL